MENSHLFRVDRCQPIRLYLDESGEIPASSLHQALGFSPKAIKLGSGPVYVLAIIEGRTRGFKRAFKSMSQKHRALGTAVHPITLQGKRPIAPHEDDLESERVQWEEVKELLEQWDKQGVFRDLPPAFFTELHMEPPRDLQSLLDQLQCSDAPSSN